MQETTYNYENVRVKILDTDIFSILLHFAHVINIPILFDTGTRDNKRLIIDITNLAEKYTPMYRGAYMALHAYTHCDTTSSFKKIGKIKLSQNPIYYPVFASIGDTWNVSDELMNKLEEFTCLMTPVLSTRQ